MSACTSVTGLPSADVPEYRRKVSPATALVPVRLTRSTGWSSSVRPPLTTSVVTAPTLSNTAAMAGVPGAVVSTR